MGKNYGTKKRDWHIVHTQSYSLHPLKTYVHTHAHRHLHFSFPFSFVLSSTPSYFDLTLWHHSRRSEMELEVVHVKARCAAQQHNQNAWKKKSDGRRKKKKKKRRWKERKKDHYGCTFLRGLTCAVAGGVCVGAGNVLQQIRTRSAPRLLPRGTLGRFCSTNAKPY